uniref:Uncharacterized protein n=1 Tax=Lotus japonicus TaxID=34305 RepID=I3SAA3_LOTJA|nr:unknown [Lotus japonicus]
MNGGLQLFTLELIAVQIIFSYATLCRPKFYHLRCSSTPEFLKAILLSF